MKFADPASAFTDCTGGVLSIEKDPDTLTLSGGTLGVPETCTVTVHVVGTATATNDSEDPFKGRAGAFWSVGAKTYTTALHAYILLLDRGNLKLHRQAGKKRTTTKARRHR